METVQPVKSVHPVTFDMVGHTKLHPKAWIEAINDHVRDSNLKAAQWLGIAKALQDCFPEHKMPDRAKIVDVISAINDLKDPIDPATVTNMQASIQVLANIEGFPNLLMINYGNYIRDKLTMPVEKAEDLTLERLESIHVGCLLVSKEMGFSEGHIQLAQDVIREVKDTSEGQLDRLNKALAALNAEYTYSSYGTTNLRKAWSYLTS